MQQKKIGRNLRKLAKALCGKGSERMKYIIGTLVILFVSSVIWIAWEIKNAGEYDDE